MGNSEGLMSVKIDGVETKMSRSFHRGETTTFRPHAAGMRRPDALARNVLAGWMPPAPFIGTDSTIVAFGSCFASHISSYLNGLGFDVATSRRGKAYVSSMGDGIVNTYAVLQQFEWAWEGRVPPVPLWHGYNALEFGYDEEVRRDTRDLFDTADVFIITLGLSEIWYDEPTGEVFWRAVPSDAFDPSRHKFRVATVQENKDNIARIHDLIRKYRPEAAIILTLSPVPLSATFRSIGPFTADAVSKASLRAAVDEVLHERSHDPRLFYFPSYEVVLGCFHHPFQDDLRHPHGHVLDLNMLAFERYFCCTGLEDADLELGYLAALAADRDVATLDEAQRIALTQEEIDWRLAFPAASVRRDKRIADRAAAIEEVRALRRQRLAERDARLAVREERLRARQKDANARNG